MRQLTDNFATTLRQLCDNRTLFGCQFFTTDNFATTALKPCSYWLKALRLSVVSSFRAGQLFFSLTFFQPFSLFSLLSRNQ